MHWICILSQSGRVGGGQGIGSIVGKYIIKETENVYTRDGYVMGGVPLAV